MTYEPIIVKLDENGKIVLTEEQLREFLKQAYNNGYSAGKNDSYVKYVPYGTNPIWYSGTGEIPVDTTKITCASSSNINGSEVKL